MNGPFQGPNMVRNVNEGSVCYYRYTPIFQSQAGMK